MTTRQVLWWTGAFVFFGLILLTAWDAWALSTGGPDATISGMIGASLVSSRWSFLFGVVTGWALCHFFGWSDYYADRKNQDRTSIARKGRRE